jgi:hypothetical protein
MTGAKTSTQYWKNLAGSTLGELVVIDNVGLVYSIGAGGPAGVGVPVFTQTVLRLPGVSGNYVSTPDSAAVSITGDIDIRARYAADNGASGGNQILVAKYDSTANLRSYMFRLTPTGPPELFLSVDGAAGVGTTASPGGAPFANGVSGWLRATWRASDGRVQFFTSADGVTWTQYGTDKTIAIASIFDSTTPLHIGNRPNPNQDHFTGTVFYADVRNGIGGAPVAVFDATAVDFQGLQVPTTYTSLSTGEVWTINGTAWWWDLTNALPLNQGIHLDPQYVYFPGTSGNYASTPDSAGLSIVGDIDLRAKVALDNWTTPSGIQTILAKWTSSGNQRSYMMNVNTTGFLRLQSSADGITTTTRTSTVPLSFANGSVNWVRAILDVDNGGGNNDTKFYTSTDGVTWTQLGATVSPGGVVGVFDSTAVVEIGSREVGVSDLFAGKVYYAEIRNGIGGSVVGQFSPLQAASSAVRTPTTFTAFSTGETWTLNGSAWEWGLYPVAVISTPDSAALSITGDIDVRAKVTVDDWLSLPGQMFLDKRSSNAGYTFRLTAGAKLEWVHGDGTTQFFKGSTVAVPFVAGQTGWIRATVDVDNGASGWDLKFYTSTDGVTWVQLGATVTTATVTSIGDGAGALAIGGSPAGTIHMPGTIHYVEVRNGIAGTVVGVFDPNAVHITNGATTPTSVPSRTGEVYTVSGSGWSWKS